MKFYGVSYHFFYAKLPQQSYYCKHPFLMFLNFQQNMLRRVFQQARHSFQNQSHAINRQRWYGILNTHSQNYKNRDDGQRRYFDGHKILLSGSIFTWLGIQKEELNKYDDDDHEKEDEPDKEIIDTIKLGVYAMQQGDFDKASSILHIALRMAQDMNHLDGVTYIYNLLADMAFQRGDYMQAERLYKSVIQRQVSKGVDQKENSIIEMSLKLAVIYGTWKQHEKAKKGFLYCIEAQEHKIKSQNDTSEDTNALWGMSRDWFAQYLMDNGRYKEAFNQFQEAFLTSCELFGDTHSQSLILLNSIGTVCSLMGDDAKAVSYFAKAVALGRATGSENLPTFMVNLGMAKLKLGLKSDANAICHDAYQMAKKDDLSEVCQEAQECLNLAGRQ